MLGFFAFRGTFRRRARKATTMYYDVSLVGSADDCESHFLTRARHRDEALAEAEALGWPVCQTHVMQVWFA